MHERSLVKRLLKQVDDVLDDNGAIAACEVDVEVGKLAGVETLLLESAFEELSRGTRAATATLTIEETPLVVRCRKCSSESEIDDFVFRCSACAAGDVQVIRGTAIVLKSVTLEQPNSYKAVR